MQSLSEVSPDVSNSDIQRLPSDINDVLTPILAQHENTEDIKTIAEDAGLCLEAPPSEEHRAIAHHVHHEMMHSHNAEIEDHHHLHTIPMHNDSSHSLDGMVIETPAKSHFKSKRSSNSEPEEIIPMGELRPTDILAGNYRKRPGNSLYKKLLREYAPDVGKVEMKVIIAKIVEAIDAQDPPGRFIREGSDGLLTSMQRSQKIARALREVAERTTKIPDAEGVIRTPKSNRKPKLDLEVNPEPIGEIRPTDVLTGNYRKRPGNYLYKRLLREEAPNVLKEEMRTVVNRIVEAIFNQEPPGRFIREGNTGIMTRGQTHQKVARALREVLDRTAKEGEDRCPEGSSGEKMSKKKAMLMEKQEPLGEIRPTDVMTGNYRKRVGNALYKRLLREHAPSFGNEETSVIVNRIIEGISNQDPPGRFVREGGGALLTRGQVRQKIARALREVVDRTRPKGTGLDRQILHMHEEMHDDDLDGGNIKMEASEGERYYDVKMEDQSFEEDHMTDMRMNYECKMEGQVDQEENPGEGELETVHGQEENPSIPEYGLIAEHGLTQDSGQVELAMGAINNLYDISEVKVDDLHQMTTKIPRDEDGSNSLDMDDVKRTRIV